MGQVAVPPITANVIGTVLGDNAIAGRIGEFKSTTVLVGAAISLTDNVVANIATLVLTPGDWDAEAVVCVNNLGQNADITNIYAWTSPTSATFPTLPNNGGFTGGPGIPASGGADSSSSIIRQRFNVTVNTTVYLSTLVGFSGGSVSGYGFISARRAR